MQSNSINEVPNINSKYVIIGIQYLTTLSLKIVNRKSIKMPAPNIYSADSDPANYNLSKNITCGVHNYFLHNNSVSILITPKEDCLLEVKQVSSIFLAAGLPINIKEFLSSDKPLTFVLRVCAFLNIPFEQVRMVGASAGSS